MRLLSNYSGKWYKKSTITEALFDLLLTEIINANTDSELFIVSPWIRNIEFKTSIRGDLKLAVNYAPSRISLLKILEEFLNRGGKLKIVCLPPDNLISQEEIDSLIQFLNLRERMEDQESKLLLSSMIAKKTSRILINKPMINFLATLKRKFSEQVKIIYNSRLHAKICLGQHLVLLGSANITNRGFQYSDEVCIITHDRPILTKIRGFCDSLLERGFSKKSEDYLLSSYLQLPDEISKLHPEIESLFKTIQSHLSSEEKGEIEFTYYTHLER